MPSDPDDNIITVAIAGTPQALTADFVCDGIHDDVELNQAAVAASALDHGIIEVAAGAYSLSTNFGIYGNNVTLRGASAGGTIFQTASDYVESTSPTGDRLGGVVTFMNVSGIACQNITVDAHTNFTVQN